MLLLALCSKIGLYRLAARLCCAAGVQVELADAIAELTF